MSPTWGLIPQPAQYQTLFPLECKTVYMQCTLGYEALSITAIMRRHLQSRFIHVEVFVLQLCAKQQRQNDQGGNFNIISSSTRNIRINKATLHESSEN